MPETIKLSHRLNDLFSKTKLVCFGRYALEVPQEAQLIWGSVSFPSKIVAIRNNHNAIKSDVDKSIAKLKWEDDTAEITYNNEGPEKGSWQIRYYEGETGKALGLHFFKTYVEKGELAFILTGTVGKGNTEDSAAMKQAARVNSLRLRMSDEVPNEPGYCIEHAFMSDNLYMSQEIVNVGVYIPSLPDVTFSISSNKDAYSDYTLDEFEKTQRAKLSLLARIKQAQDEQGIHYPSRTVLREGKRDVQHWHGEESLIKRMNGVHDFEWSLVGTPKNIANPAEFNVQMYTKVEHNVIGAAQETLLSDDEAVALWDKLLLGLKFRVKVPGAPEGSYFIPSNAVGSTRQPQ